MLSLTVVTQNDNISFCFLMVLWLLLYCKYFLTNFHTWYARVVSILFYICTKRRVRFFQEIQKQLVVPESNFGDSLKVLFL